MVVVVVVGGGERLAAQCRACVDGALCVYVRRWRKSANRSMDRESRKTKNEWIQDDAARQNQLRRVVESDKEKARECGVGGNRRREGVETRN